MRNRGLASQETPQEHMSIVRQKISFQHQAPIRKTNAFSTCFYTSFLSRDFPFCIDILHTYSYSHLDFHTRHLFTKIAYQVTQVPREFDTRFLPFYTTFAIWCTCRKQTMTMFCLRVSSNLIVSGWQRWCGQPCLSLHAIRLDCLLMAKRVRMTMFLSA